MIDLRIEECRHRERPVSMRLPFQFGNTEVRRTAEACCEVTVSVQGRKVTGRSAQLMVPRWFDKRAGLSNEQTVDELRHAVAAACGAAPGLRGTAVAVCREVRGATADAMPEATPALAAGFGPALVEMAVIDAACHAAGLPFWRAAREDVFGLVAACPADLPAEALRAALAGIGPPTSIALRHTIGFDAPLTAAEAEGQGPRDGLPVSVEEVAAQHGIAAFKVKLKGDPDADIARLSAIAGVLASLPGYSVTLDANEQYEPEAFREFLGRLGGERRLERLAGAVRFFEQPFAREIALSGLGRVAFGVPLIIDESDDAEDAFARALELGWAGTSIKSCKGVFRALLNMARARRAGAIVSGEDLTCQPGLCWQQDTAMAAAAGVADVERNGHHFAGGMQGAAEEEIAARLAAHPDIYVMREARPDLRIERGRVGIGSLDAPGFGRAGTEP